MDKLLPCPLCGGEAKTVLADTYPHRGMLHSWFVACKDSECGCELGFYGMDENGTCGTYETEAEAIAAWNTRAAYENEGFFYLPKPQDKLYDIRNQVEKITTDEIGDNVRVTAQVKTFIQIREEAAKKWADSIGETVMRGVCEVYAPQKTCQMKLTTVGYSCSVCHSVDWTEKNKPKPNYCPNCGAKVVE